MWVNLCGISVKLLTLQTCCHHLFIAEHENSTHGWADTKCSSSEAARNFLTSQIRCRSCRSRGASLSSVSPHMLKWWLPHYICRQTKLTQGTNPVKTFGWREEKKEALKRRMNGGKKKSSSETISTRDHSIIWRLFSPLKSSTHGLYCAGAEWTTLERIWFGLPNLLFF